MFFIHIQFVKKYHCHFFTSYELRNKDTIIYRDKSTHIYW